MVWKICSPSICPERSCYQSIGMDSRDQGNDVTCKWMFSILSEMTRINLLLCARIWNWNFRSGTIFCEDSLLQLKKKKKKVKNRLFSTQIVCKNATCTEIRSGFLHPPLYTRSAPKIMPPILLFWWIDGCWWYVSTVWTFLPIFCYILLLQDRQQQRGSLTEWCLTWKGEWSKGVELNSSMWEKWHPLMFTDIYWTFMETNQWMWAQWGVGGAFQHWQKGCERQATFQMAMQIFMTAACWLLFIAGENEGLMVMTTLKKRVL